MLVFSIALVFLTGFDKIDRIHVSSIDTTIIKAENILRYDIKLKNSSTIPFESEFDYPGHHYYGLELVVRPNKKLASKMEMDKESKYMKMIPMGSGGTGRIEPGKEGSFHVEYQIKDGENLKEVEWLALDSTLLILDGTEIIKEVPLNNE